MVCTDSQPSRSTHSECERKQPARSGQKMDPETENASEPHPLTHQIDSNANQETIKEAEMHQTTDTDSTDARADKKRVRKAVRIAAFDLDGTLICTRGRHIHAKHAGDWRFLHAVVADKMQSLHRQGFHIVIFTNQKGLPKHEDRMMAFRAKIQSIARQWYASLEEDVCRKPRIGMWHQCLIRNGWQADQVDHTHSFYVGDAAGRPAGWQPGAKADHSASDVKFARNLSLPFHTPEQFFLGHAVDSGPGELGGFQPARFMEVCVPRVSFLVHPPPDGDLEMVLMVGSPASGKTFFIRQHLQPHGYVRVSQDELGSMPQCLDSAKTHFMAGRSVVIGGCSLCESHAYPSFTGSLDNTNPDRQSRKPFLLLAQSMRIKTRCLLMLASLDPDQSEHNNMFRHLTGQGVRVPTVAMRSFYSRFEKPTDGEFDEIHECPFVPQFKCDEHAALYRMYLC